MSKVPIGSPKTCIGCQRFLPAESFYKSKNARDKRQSRCIRCERQRMALLEQRTQSESHDYYLANKPVFLERERRNTLRRKYGLTVGDFWSMVERQGGLCAICGLPPRASGPRRAPPILHIDHDHRTEKVRALLCGQCNRAIGLLADDPERAMRLAVYLESHATATKEAA